MAELLTPRNALRFNKSFKESMLKLFSFLCILIDNINSSGTALKLAIKESVKITKRRNISFINNL